MSRIVVEQWRTLSALLDRALDVPTDARDAWIDGLGGDDAVLAPVLRDMLARGERLEGEHFLDALATLGGEVESPSEFAAGVAIGPYRLLRPLGAGGMGEVWLAERADGAMHRTVALKLPLVALSRGAVAERFARERDILAALEHPGIARLYDAGVTSDGQPYLALEFVDGVPIDRYADAHRLGVDARLALFEQVLDAIAYAHANLVLHRDIKPSNLLVTPDGKAKLLDFGIAKLMADGRAQETALTRMAGRAMTLDYAAPEHVAAQPLTTAADVYSLGVLLYELVAGERPYRTRHGTQAELAEAIVQADIEPPSARRASDAAAHARASTPARLRRALRGDLDTIVLKALRKRPEDRYATARAFAEDLDRHRNGQPVLARPDSMGYRAMKFAGRHRAALAVTALVAVVLVGATIVAVRQAHQATLEAARANAVQAFMTDLFRANSSRQADPVKARQTTAIELLDLGAGKIETALNDAPAAKLATLRLFGDLYDDLEVNDRAVTLRKQAVALARSLYGTGDPRVAKELMDLDYSLRASSFVNERAATIAEAERILDAAHDERSILRAHLLMRKADYYSSIDRPRAREYVDRASALYRALGESHDLANAMYLRSQIDGWLGRWQDSRDDIRQAIDIVERTDGPRAPELTQYYAYLAEAEFGLDDYASAENSYRRALAAARAVNGDHHVDTLQAELRLGKFLVDTGRMQEGLHDLRAARDLALSLRGPDDPFHTPPALLEYGWGMARYGEVVEGLDNMEQAIANRRRNRPGTQFLANMLDDAAFALIELGRFDEAHRYLDESRAIKLTSERPPAPLFNHNVVMRARLAVAEGRPREAAEMMAEYAVKEPVAGRLSLTGLEVDVARAETALAQSDFIHAADAASNARRRLAASALAMYMPGVEGRAAYCEGRARLALGDPAAALPLLERTAALRREALSPASPGRLQAEAALAEAYLALDRRADAERALDQARSVAARNPRLGPQYTRDLERSARLLASR